jgi:hypothetical protein
VIFSHSASSSDILIYHLTSTPIRRRFWTIYTKDKLKAVLTEQCLEFDEFDIALLKSQAEK